MSEKSYKISLQNLKEYKEIVRFFFKTWLFHFLSMVKNKGKKTSTPLGYFNAHECHLGANKLTSYQIKCNPLRRCILDLMSVKMSDIRARNMFKSYAALCAEKYRHYKYYPLSIHPFSTFRIFLEAYFVIAMLISNLMITWHFNELETKPKIPLNIYFEKQDVHILIIHGLDSIYLMNMIVNFFTGYVGGGTHEYVVLDLKKICIKYAKTWLIVDLLTVLSIFGIFMDTSESMIWHILLTSLRLLRLPGWMKYLDNVMIAMKAHIYKRTMIHIIVLILSFITWTIYFSYAVEFIIEGSLEPISPRNCSWLTVASVWDVSQDVRFVYSFNRAIGILRRNANMNLIDQETCSEVFLVVFWFIARILIYHCTLKYTVALFGSESAKAKYFIMTKQVENFMNQKKFPPRIKKKILKFYAIRFQSNFFVESKMLACVTGQLREDIIMHTGRQLIREIQFLKQMPRSLHLQIGSKLKIVVFIAGDIIFKINTLGDCLYFIDKGTVAIYSESGNEICHLEDGDFFGEIALVMKHRFRTASVVAVTNCELFRLDKEDFDSSIACYPTVYESIKKVAINRFEKTYVMDEHHKAVMKMGDDNNDSISDMEY